MLISHTQQLLVKQTIVQSSSSNATLSTATAAAAAAQIVAIVAVQALDANLQPNATKVKNSGVTMANDGTVYVVSFYSEVEYQSGV